jgi:hypothetical protein
VPAAKQASGAGICARGAHFLTEPKVHATEIRGYIRGLDSHLIEVGQTTAGPRPA